VSPGSRPPRGRSFVFGEPALALIARKLPPALEPAARVLAPPPARQMLRHLRPNIPRR
jgi:hypothetical protein